MIFTAAVTLSHVFWGGRFNPIIPCADRAMAEALISAFNVDALYNISGTDAVEAFVKNFPHLQWPEVGIRLTQVTATACGLALGVGWTIRS